MKMVITGDISNFNIPSFTMNNLNPRFRDKLGSADRVVFNLEGPLLESTGSPNLEIRSNRFKNFCYTTMLRFTGNIQPTVWSDQRLLSLLNLNPSTVVTLANNHIKDFGTRGFLSTRKLLHENNILFLGAGMNIAKANRPLFLEPGLSIFNVNYVASKKQGVPFLVYNATKNDYGASFIATYQLKKLVRQEKRSGRKTLLIVHAGKEVSLNSPVFNLDLEPFLFVDADVTVVHHPHVYQETPFEKDGVFVLGDFIFNRPGHLAPDRESAILELDVEPDSISFELTRFRVSDVYDYEKSSS